MTLESDLTGGVNLDVNAHQEIGSSNDDDDGEEEPDHRACSDSDATDPNHAMIQQNKQNKQRLLSRSRSRSIRSRNRNRKTKAPGAPKRFKSSYICFFLAKRQEIQEALGENATMALISRRSAELWKGLSVEQRAHWENAAAQDKQRFIAEKAAYTGPWMVPYQRARKNPAAPKRPMSAFLFFAQKMRAQVKNQHPEAMNIEISRLLGEIWRNLSPEERLPFCNQEKAEREQYKVKTAVFKEKEKARQAEEEHRKTEEAYAARMLLPPAGAPHLPDNNTAPILYPTSQLHGQQPAPTPHIMFYPSYNPRQRAVPAPFDCGPVVLAPNGLPRYPVVVQAKPLLNSLPATIADT